MSEVGVPYLLCSARYVGIYTRAGCGDNVYFATGNIDFVPYGDPDGWTYYDRWVFHFHRGGMTYV